nr:alpha/beta hydrolase [Psychromicrobium silvestre]
MGWNQVSVQPGASIVRVLFEANAFPEPPNFAEIQSTVSVTSNISIPTPEAPNAALDIYVPKQASAKPRPIVMWVHGGGFISGSKEQVRDYVTVLAAKGFVVASLDYSLAPGTQYPAPIRQGNAALKYLSDHATNFGGDKTAMFVGGDSAGSQIASQLAALQTNPTLARQMNLTPGIASSALRGALLFCGLYNMETVGSTGFPALRSFLWSYTGYRDWLSYPDISQLSTTGNVTSAYPATLLTVGDADPFESQGKELVAALNAKKVPVTSQFYTGSGAKLGHEYQFDFSHPESQKMFDLTVSFLTTHSSKGNS